jgi:hypothetical protein
MSISDTNNRLDITTTILNTRTLGTPYSTTMNVCIILLFDICEPSHNMQRTDGSWLKVKAMTVTSTNPFTGRDNNAMMA